MNLLVIFFALFLVVLGGHAGGEEQPVFLRLRALWHDPLRPIVNLYAMDKSGALAAVNLRPHDLSEPQTVMLQGGMLFFYDRPEIDPQNPKAGLVASAKISEGMRQAIVVIVPTGEAGKVFHRVVVIDEEKKAFPFGESIIISLVNANVAVQAGEHLVTVKPGKWAKIPRVRKLNEFNMGQTNFFVERAGGKSFVFAERQLQFIDECRRLFVIHKTPGALQPSVTTIVDTDRGR